MDSLSPRGSLCSNSLTGKPLWSLGIIASVTSKGRCHHWTVMTRRCKDSSSESGDILAGPDPAQPKTPPWAPRVYGSFHFHSQIQPLSSKSNTAWWPGPKVLQPTYLCAGTIVCTQPGSPADSHRRNSPLALFKSPHASRYLLVPRSSKQILKK